MPPSSSSFVLPKQNLRPDSKCHRRRIDHRENALDQVEMWNNLSNPPKPKKKKKKFLKRRGKQNKRKKREKGEIRLLKPEKQRENKAERTIKKKGKIPQIGKKKNKRAKKIIKASQIKQKACSKYLLWMRNAETNRVLFLNKEAKPSRNCYKLSSSFSVSEANEESGLMEGCGLLYRFLGGCSNPTKRLFTFQTEVVERMHSFKANRHTIWKGDDFPPRTWVCIII